MIDPAMISSVLLFHLHHPVSFLAAERVMRRRFISMIATAMGCITLRRVWDRATLGRGRIFAPDITNEPQLIKGRGTRFDQDAKVGDFVMIVVAKQRILRAEISGIRGPQELYLKEGFTGLDNPKEVLTDSLYSLARKPESDNAFPSIFAKFKEGGAICMFPEGTTHDQSDLLPLKSKNPFKRNRLTYLTLYSGFRSYCAVLFGRQPSFNSEPCSLWNTPYQWAQISVQSSSRV
jgi:glycerol-3-phosphate O-acyltransferase / dihydroxyacetone phosphate acyltransferase